MEESLEQIQQLHIQWCNPIRPQLTTHRQCCECKSLKGHLRHVHNLICGQVDVPAKCCRESHKKRVVVEGLTDLVVTEASLIGTENLGAPILERAHLVWLQILPSPSWRGLQVVSFGSRQIRLPLCTTHRHVEQDHENHIPSCLCILITFM